MYGESGQVVETDEVRDAIARADVLVIGFPYFAERLLVDSRTAPDAGPMVRVVEPLGGIEERMHWLGRNRPRFGVPQRFTFFVWPHSIAFLAELGLVNALRASVDEGDGPRQLDRALASLRGLEARSQRAAILGDKPWRTLWHAEGTRRGR